MAAWIRGMHWCFGSGEVSRFSATSHCISLSLQATINDRASQFGQFEKKLIAIKQCIKSFDGEYLPVSRIFSASAAQNHVKVVFANVGHLRVVL